MRSEKTEPVPAGEKQIFPVKVRILDIGLDPLTMDETIAEVIKALSAGRQIHIITANVDHAVMKKDPELLARFAGAEFTVADGVPLLWAARFLKRPLRERINGCDLFVRVCETAAVYGKKVFLLGAPEGVALEASLKLKKNCPGLTITGIYSPRIGFENDEAECSKICGMINESGTDIVCTSLGSPKGIRWIETYRSRYMAAVSIEVGASFSYVSGRLKRAPRWMQNSGLEWFWRLLHEPRRLWKRYLVRDMPFFWRILRQKIAQNSPEI